MQMTTSVLVTDFVERCRLAAAQPDAVVAVRAEVETLLGSCDRLAQALPAPPDCTAVSGASNTIFEDDSVAIMAVHTPPGIQQPPHDHQMSVVIGGYVGVEEHRLFQRTPHASKPIEYTRSTDVGVGDILTLGPAAVHAIDATGPTWASAIHVYLGRLSTVDRSLFNPETFTETPLDLDLYDEWCVEA